MSFAFDAAGALAVARGGIATIATVATVRVENRHRTGLLSQLSQLSQGVAARPGSVDAFDERAGMAADSVPALYLDAWARLQCQKPARVSEADWRLALDDGGRVLDGWGQWAVALGWSPGDLFDVPDFDRRGGLIWHLRGERVEALGPDHARMSDERIFDLKG